MAKEFVSEDNAPVVTEEREILDKNPNTEGILLKYRQPVQKKTENDNGRVYTEQFWKEAVFNDSKTQNRLERGLMVGRLKHPESGVKVNPEKLSHRVTELIDGAKNENLDNELIYGTVEVFDTPGGNVLNTLVRAETKIGQSSRALVDYYNDGATEVITDGSLRGFDAVLGPSVTEALPPDINQEDIDDLGGGEESVDLSETMETVASQIRQHSSENESAKLVCESIDNFKEDLDMADDLEEIVEDKKEKISTLKERLDEKESTIEEKEKQLEQKEEKISELRESIESDSDADVIPREKVEQRIERVRKESKRMMKDVLEDIREVAIPEDQAVEKVEELVGFIHSVREKVQDEYIKEAKAKEAVKNLKEKLRNFKEASKKSVTQVLEKADKKVKQSRKELEEKAIRMVADHRLSKINRENDQSFREHILSADSIQEAKNRADELEELVKQGATEEQIQEHAGSEVFENDITKSTYKTIANM